LNSYSLTVQSFDSFNANLRTIDFGTGKIVAIRNAGVCFSIANATNLTVLGSKNVEVTYSGSVGTREVYAGTTEATAVNLKVTGGSDIMTIASMYQSLDFTGFSGTLSAQNRTIFGDVVFSSGMTVSGGTTTFASTSGIKSITTNGAAINCSITFNGLNGYWMLQDNLVIGSTQVITLTNGTFDANNKNVTSGTFALGAGTKTLALGNGTWTVAGSGTAWNANTNVANLTVSPSTGRISMTSASAKTFAGGARAWPTLNQGGSGALTIQQSNTFANITNSVQPATITLTAGTTQTVAAFGVSGTAGNLITLNSSAAGTRATLSDSVGTVEVSNVSIKDINATGGANWNAFLKSGNVDAGNNLGWDFFPAVRQVFGQVFSSIFRPIF
jgi:hypothetical protein